MYDMIVIGGGPAGLTAAIYAIRKRLNILLISEDLGGKTNYNMEIPGEETYLVIRGSEIVTKFKQELEYLHYAHLIGKVEKISQQGEIFVVKCASGEELQSRSIILCTGARVQRLGIPGEAEFRGRGLGYSAMSYAPMFLDKEVFVVGDGELALRATAELATVAKMVHLVMHGQGVLDSPIGRKLKKCSNVEVLHEYDLVQVKGNEFVQKVVVRSADGKQKELNTDGVFVEKALIPNTEMLKDLAIEKDEKGRIKIDCQCRTNIPGLFAAGDVTNSTEQILVAVGDGAKAAISAYNYLLPYL